MLRYSVKKSPPPPSCCDVDEAEKVEAEESILVTQLY